LLVLITYAYHNARFKKHKVYSLFLTMSVWNISTYFLLAALRSSHWLQKRNTQKQENT